MTEEGRNGVGSASMAKKYFGSGFFVWFWTAKRVSELSVSHVSRWKSAEWVLTSKLHPKRRNIIYIFRLEAKVLERSFH